MNNVFYVCVATLLCLGLLGCDTTVDRFEENDLHYSIFGYLDSSADTQFVRVELLRDSMLVRPPDFLDTEVTLTNLATDRTVSLRDSLFHFGQEASAYNFYTSTDIEPSTPYRLIVRGPDGAESRVQTSVPDRFPDPSVPTPIPECFPNCPTGGSPACGGPNNEDRFALLLLEGIDRLVAVRALYHMEKPEGVWSFGHLADTTQVGEDEIRAPINYGDDWCNLPGPEEGESRMQRRIEVVVAAGSSDWPEFVALDLETEMLPGVASNVQGGVGFLGGIVTDTVTISTSVE